MRILLLVFLLACDAPAQGTDGARLFRETCARCHGNDGHGDPVMVARLGVPDMTDPAWQRQHSDDDIWYTIRNGSRTKKMPPLGNMYTGPQLEAIVRHVRSLARK